MKKEELRSIPKKNYLILGVVLVVTLLLVYYFYIWTSAYQETKLNESVLDNYMQVINYNELDDYLVENPDAVIYVSKYYDEDINKFEKSFAKLVRGNELKLELLYLNITDELENDELRSEIKNKYTANSVSIADVPSIMVYSSGELKYVYSIKENGYNVKAAKKYINSLAEVEEGNNG